MNIYTFTGHIGKDAEVRHTPNGKVVCSFPVAVTSGWGDNQTTAWWNCSIWGKRAEGGLVPYLKKGAAVAISGEPSFRNYEYQGENRESKELRVNEIDLMGGKPEAKPAAPKKEPAAAEPLNDEIPF